MDHCPLVVDGFVEIPNGPGLGVNLVENEKTIQPLVQLIKPKPHIDGFVMDQ